MDINRIAFRVNSLNRYISFTFVLLTLLGSASLFFTSVDFEFSISSLIRSLYITTHFCVFYVLCFYFSDEGGVNFELSYVLTVTTCIAVLFSLVSFVDPSLREGLKEGQFFFSANRRYQGYLVLIPTVMYSIRLLMKQTNVSSYLGLVVCLGYLVWLGGRGAIVAYLGSVALAAVYLIYCNQFRASLMLRLALVWLFTVVITLPLNVFKWNGLNRFLDPGQTLDALSSSSMVARYELWQEAYANFLDKPWFGYGAEAHYYITEIGFLQPHNFILQWLVEFGLVGTTLLLSLMALLTWRVCSKALFRGHRHILPAFMAFAALIAQGLIDGNFYHAAPLMVFFVLCAYMAAEVTKIEEQQS
ncbi:O-antigen ligase family protein [Vibrio maerlii]|uniref:O-antigen ligase family protein n=1 Tax=Vibrio maerlii TaxID=2231648 RepID=UPI0013DE991A|nr:O-antigen ligase family protein [Vibrio maerlii]